MNYFWAKPSGRQSDRHKWYFFRFLSDPLLSQQHISEAPKRPWVFLSCHFLNFIKLELVSRTCIEAKSSNNKCFPSTNSESHSSSTLQWYKEVTIDPTSSHHRPRNQFSFLIYSLIIIVKHSSTNSPKPKKIKAASLLRVLFLKSDPESSIQILPHFLFLLFWLIRVSQNNKEPISEGKKSSAKKTYRSSMKVKDFSLTEKVFLAWRSALNFHNIFRLICKHSLFVFILILLKKMIAKYLLIALLLSTVSCAL